jgi:hypothetical protein
MVSKQLIKTFLNKQICFHLIKCAKIQKIPNADLLKNKNIYNINVAYSKQYLTTRYDMQCDGSFLTQNEIGNINQVCNITYDNKEECLQDTKFLKLWSIDVHDDLLHVNKHWCCVD